MIEGLRVAVRDRVREHQARPVKEPRPASLRAKIALAIFALTAYVSMCLFLPGLINPGNGVHEGLVLLGTMTLTLVIAGVFVAVLMGVVWLLFKAYDWFRDWLMR